MGRMMSARMVSFSSHRCWTTMRLDLGAAEGLDRLEAVVPAGGAAGVVHPDHVDLGAALFLRDRVVVPCLNWSSSGAKNCWVLPELQRDPSRMAWYELGLGDDLLGRDLQLPLAGEDVTALALPCRLSRRPVDHAHVGEVLTGRGRVVHPVVVAAHLEVLMDARACPGPACRAGRPPAGPARGSRGRGRTSRRRSA